MDFGTIINLILFIYFFFAFNLTSLIFGLIFWFDLSTYKVQILFPKLGLREKEY